MTPEEAMAVANALGALARAHLPPRTRMLLIVVGEGEGETDIQTGLCCNMSPGLAALVLREVLHSVEVNAERLRPGAVFDDGDPRKRSVS